MGIDNDIQEIKKIFEAKPIFKPASRANLAKRQEEIGKNVDKAEVVRMVRKGLGYQFESYPWHSMLRDIGLNPAEIAWAEEHLYYTVGCTDPTFPVDTSY